MKHPDFSNLVFPDKAVIPNKDALFEHDRKEIAKVAKRAGEKFKKIFGR